MRLSEEPEPRCAADAASPWFEARAVILRRERAFFTRASLEGWRAHLTMTVSWRSQISDIFGPTLTLGTGPSHIISMAPSRKKATTIALDPDDDRLLSRAARERGISRSEFIRQHLAIVLEQYRRHPKPRSAGIVRELKERGDERQLFGAGR